MTRSKATARKSTSGLAPRSKLATTDASKPTNEQAKESNKHAWTKQNAPYDIIVKGKHY
jgi:hypothetical protein